MKHIFIINPVAGNGVAEAVYLPKILTAVKEFGLEYEVHRTINVGDATRYVKSRCAEEEQESFRFYAIGGDGTLNEVVNGAMGHSNAEVAFLPSGTGNDFARSFQEHMLFRDVSRQIRGTARLVDVIRYNDRYAINMLNIGLDCQVVSEMNRLKKYPFIRGPLAYIAGVGVVFVGNQGYEFQIELEDGQTMEEEFTLIAIGNGAFCGGGFKGVPLANLQDGLFDINLVRKVNRRAFASLIGSYRKGTHLEHPLAKDRILYLKGKRLKMKSPDGEQFQVCVDGEIEQVKELVVDVLPKAILFSVPEGCD